MKVLGRTVCLFLAVALAASGCTTKDEAPAAREVGSAKSQVWTCSMHPQVRQPRPGKCPICRMALVPVETGDEVGPRQFRTSAAAKKLMEIETTRVERRFVTAEVRMVGKVAYDETRLARITAWVPGRLDRMFVDYTGIPVKAGDHMVVIYSPELLAAQAELLQAKEAIKRLERSRIDIMRENAQATFEAAREKLRLWGLTRAQVAAIEARGKAEDTLQINAPMGGIVIEKHVNQGDYVKTGTPLYTIADLSQVWVRFDAYESDLKWLRYGQQTHFTAEAYPGEEFVGRISFIDPVLDPRTRTVKVRVNVPNEAGRLKPNMFVRGVVRSRVASGGKVMDPGLAGKWISPMHPEVVKDAPGACDVCGMPLVRAESLGYVLVTEEEVSKPLVIPVSAALATGKRAVVYVEVPDAENPTYEGREVVLGARAGDFYIVKGGLAEGDIVVTHGGFKIDSALQIQAKPSMMGPGRTRGAAPPKEGKHVGRLTVPDAFRKQLGGVYARYLALVEALAADRFVDAREAARKTDEALRAIDAKALEGPAAVLWVRAAANLHKVLHAMTDAADTQAIRKDLALLSEELAVVVKAFGIAPERAVYRIHCPMAFSGRGADWLQDVQEVRNPYFGAAMLKCGSVVGTIREGVPEHD